MSKEYIELPGPWVCEKRFVRDSLSLYQPYIDAYRYFPDSDKIFYICKGVSQRYSRSFLIPVLGVNKCGDRHKMGLYHSCNPDVLLFTDATELDMALLRIKFGYFGCSFKSLELDEIQLSSNGRVSGRLIFDSDGHLPTFSFMFNNYIKSYSDYADSCDLR